VARYQRFGRPNCLHLKCDHPAPRLRRREIRPSTPSYIFIAWTSIPYRENFTLFNQIRSSFATYTFHWRKSNTTDVNNATQQLSGLARGSVRYRQQSRTDADWFSSDHVTVSARELLNPATNSSTVLSCVGRRAVLCRAALLSQP
jgi:hypothetical protein